MVTFGISVQERNIFTGNKAETDTESDGAQNTMRNYEILIHNYENVI